MATPQKRLTGPAYKNRRPAYRPVNARTYRYRKVRMITGPRRKNWHAKSRGPQW